MPDGVQIETVEGGIHGSIIAGGAVKDVTLFQAGDIEGSYNVIGNGARLVIQQIEAFSPAQEMRKAEEIAAHQLSQAIKAKVESLQRLLQKSGGERKNPYKALNFYQLEDAPYFYGRDQGIHDLLDKLHQARLTILYADSGAGKSSLLRAGLAARLLAAGHLPVNLRLRGNAPVSQTIKKALIPDLDDSQDDQSLEAFLTKVNRRLGQSNLYIFLDQFEEFFLKLAPSLQKGFINELHSCLDMSELDVRWILSLRGEYLYRLYHFGSHIRSNEYYLPPFTENEARQVIIQPAQAQHTTYTDGLVDRILVDLAQQDDSAAAGYQPPQVQLICHTLFAGVKDQAEPRIITSQQYEREDRARGILTSHLGRVIGQLPHRQQQDVARELLEALITVSLEKQQVRDSRTEAALIAEIEKRLRDITPSDVQAVLKFLVDNYLLRTEDDPEHRKRYELTHDYLLGEIALDPATQQRKLAEQMLRQEVNSFLSSGKKTLIAADKLVIIEPYVENIVLSDEAQELLVASRAAISAARQKEKRQFRIIQVSGTLAVVFVIAAISALIFLNGAIREADQARQDVIQAQHTATADIKLLHSQQAEAEAAAIATLDAVETLRQQAETNAAAAAERANRVTRAGQLANESQLVFEDNPLLGLRLGLEGLFLIPEDDPETQRYFERPVRQFIKYGRLLKLGDHDVLRLVAAPDNSVFFVDRGTNEFYLVNTTQTIPLSNEAAIQADFSPNGAFFWASYQEGSWIEASPGGSELRRTDTGQILFSTVDKAIFFDEVTFGPDWRYFITTGSFDMSDTLYALHLTGTVAITTFQDRVTEVTFSPTGDRFLVTYWQGSYRGALDLYQTDGQQVARVADQAQGKGIFSPDGRYIIVEGLGDQLYDGRTGRAIPLSEAYGQVKGISFITDTTYFLVEYENTLELRALDTAQPVPLSETHGQIKKIEFNSPGTHFVTHYEDGTIELRHADENEIVPLATSETRGQIRRIEFSNLGTHFVTHYEDGTIELRRANQNEIVPLPTDHPCGDFYGLDFSPQGYHLVLVYDLCSEIRRIDTFELEYELCTDCFLSLFSPTERFAAYHTDVSMLLWVVDLNTKKRVATLGSVAGLQFSQKDNYFVAEDEAGQKTTIRSTDHAILPISDFQKVRYSPDETYIVVTYPAGRSELWHGPRGMRLTDLGTNVENLYFAVDHQQLLVEYADGAVYVIGLDWLETMQGNPEALSSADLVPIACWPFEQGFFKDEQALQTYLRGEPSQACLPEMR